MIGGASMGFLMPFFVAVAVVAIIVKRHTLV